MKVKAETRVFAIAIVGVLVVFFCLVTELALTEALWKAEALANVTQGGGRLAIFSPTDTDNAFDFAHPTSVNPSMPSIRWHGALGPQPVFYILSEEGCSPWPERQREKFDKECRYIYVSLSGKGRKTLVVNRHTGNTAKCNATLPYEDLSLCPRP